MVNPRQLVEIERERSERAVDELALAYFNYAKEMIFSTAENVVRLDIDTLQQYDAIYLSRYSTKQRRQYVRSAIFRLKIFLQRAGWTLQMRRAKFVEGTTEIYLIRYKEKRQMVVVTNKKDMLQELSGELVKAVEKVINEAFDEEGGIFLSTGIINIDYSKLTDVAEKVLETCYDENMRENIINKATKDLEAELQVFGWRAEKMEKYPQKHFEQENIRVYLKPIHY